MQISPCSLMFIVMFGILPVAMFIIFNFGKILNFITSPFRMVYQAFKEKRFTLSEFGHLTFRTTVVTAVVILLWIASTTKYTMVPCNGNKTTAMTTVLIDCGCK